MKPISTSTLTTKIFVCFGKILQERSIQKFAEKEQNVQGKVYPNAELSGKLSHPNFVETNLSR